MSRPTIKDLTGFPRLRRDRKSGTKGSCLDGNTELIPRKVSDSEMSVVSNHYLVETDCVPEIDQETRMDIEKKFRKSVMNAHYVFPRSGVEKPKPQLRTIDRRNREHKASHSFSESRDASRLVRRK